MRILVTGGCGFIGSHFVRRLLTAHPEHEVVNIDKLTYAGNPANLKDIEGDRRYRFVRGDISEVADVRKAMEGGIDAVVNLAAETHVDRSLMGAGSFIQTDVFGTYVLMEECRRAGVTRYLQVSTDEVYGSVEEGSFTEESPLSPNSPYAASKAGGDMMVRAYVVSHGFPAIITRCSNNYGPNQYPEKMIPLFVTNLIDGKKVPLYGDGMNVRDWIHVEDHCSALDFVLHKGSLGEVYNISADNELTNREITSQILRLLEKDASWIEPVPDRPGHDRRYSLSSAKLRLLGWAPTVPFERGIGETISWYVDHPEWWKVIKSGEFMDYYRRQYGAST
jgi:dTDP-glucose 4,6-dehydratase